jgi:methyltransferase (TIGR00027 family)
MQVGRVSRTAEFMGLFRALESVRRPAAARLFEDPFAARLLPASLRAVVATARLPLVGGGVARLIDRRWPGARSSGVARTRLIDEALAAALHAGIDQVVILGAGFDCRAYRLSGIERARVFEVDYPSTSAAKRARLAALLGGLPGHVTFVALDFDRQPLLAALAAAGCDRGRRSIVIWEGVTNYLTAAAVDATLRAIATFAPGSRLLFTYVHRGVLDGSVAFEGAERLGPTLRRAREPWTFGFDPAELPAYLAARGIALVDDLGADDYRARYLGAAGRGYAFYRVAVARVGGDATGGDACPR